MFRALWLVEMVDLQDLSCVFDRKLIRSGEICEYVVTGAVSPDAPFDRVTIVPHASCSTHDGI